MYTSFTFPAGSDKRMNPLVYLAMFGWLPFVLYLFAQQSTQKALVFSFVAAWLFLPEADFPLLGLPDYTKVSATCYGALLGTVLFDFARIQSFRLGWLDIPMVIWCLCPIMSSITNDLGAYDGFSSALSKVVAWGIPYFLGRVYLNSLEGLKRLAIAIFLGGLAYIPLCLFEARMSPQLHRMVYGFTARSGGWAQNMRYGGWRPTVFMEHGLMVGAWMMVAALVSFWLWQTGIMKKFWNIPIQAWVAALFVTVIAVKSTGAWLLLGIGIMILMAVQWFRSAFLVAALIGYMTLYIYSGATGTFNSEQVVSTLSTVINEERISSFEYRIENEELLSEKARERVVFGWAGYGRGRVLNPETGRDAVTDSLWIIAFSQNGAVGLISLMSALLLPVIAFMTSYPARLWMHPKVAPAAVLAVGLTLYVFDCVLNAMVNPIYTLICGGIAGLALGQGTVKRTSTAARARSAAKRYVTQQQ